MRIHTPEQVKQIADSMERFGVTTPVLVDEDGELIFGHGRYRAAQELKLDYLPVSVAHGWTQDEKKAYRITDNQLALNSGWDIPLLEAEVKELKLEGFELNLLGFGDAQLAALTMPTVLDPLNEWRNMPEFFQPAKNAYRSILVHFSDQNGVDKFAKAIEQNITDKTRALWYPPVEVEQVMDKRWVSDAAEVSDLHPVEGSPSESADDEASGQDGRAVQRRGGRAGARSVRAGGNGSKRPARSR
jgi:hypothetical protein